MTEQANIWDRQEAESAPAYQAARLYFEMGIGNRSLETVAQKLAKSLPLLKRWSSRWSWVGRAAAYDAHMLAIEQAERERVRAEEAAKWERRRIEQREHDWQMAETLRQRAAEMAGRDLEVVRVVQKQERAPDGRLIWQEVHEHHPAGWNWGVVPKAAETASKLARLAAELETERADLTVHDERPDLSKLTDEELEIYERLTAKAADTL